MKRKAPTGRRSRGVGDGETVFVEVDRLAPAPWKKADSAWHNRQ